MAFSYALSKVVELTMRKNEAGQDVIVLEFRYVRFELALDDPEKQSVLRSMLGGVQEQSPPPPPVKMPRFYGR